MIDKDVALPISRLRYPKAEDMSIGDSFFIKTNDPRDKQRAISSMVSKAKNKGLDFKFSVRTVYGGYRIWRVK